MPTDPTIRSYLVHGQLPPELERALRLIETLPPNLTLEQLQAQHDLERQQACDEMDKMAVEFAAAEKKRKKLWGNKFPRVLGAKPPEINRVKQQTGKTAKKRKK